MDPGLAAVRWSVTGHRGSVQYLDTVTRSGSRESAIWWSTLAGAPGGAVERRAQPPGGRGLRHGHGRVLPRPRTRSVAGSSGTCMTVRNERLVTVGIGLRAIQGNFGSAGANGDADRVDGLVADLAATIEELRRLTDELPPPRAGLGDRCCGVPGARRTRAYPGHRGCGSSSVSIADLETTHLLRRMRGPHQRHRGRTARSSHGPCALYAGDGSLVVSVADDGVGGTRAQGGFRTGGAGGPGRCRWRPAPRRVRHTGNPADRGGSMQVILVEDQAHCCARALPVVPRRWTRRRSVAWRLRRRRGCGPGVCTPRCCRPRRAVTPLIHRRGHRAAAALKSTQPTWVSSSCCATHRDSARRGSCRSRWIRLSAEEQDVLEVSDFIDAVGRVADGGSALDPQVVAALLNRKTQQDDLARLTEREHEVLWLMALGMTDTGIAETAGPQRTDRRSPCFGACCSSSTLPIVENADRRVLAVLIHLGVRPAPTSEQMRYRRWP